MFQFIRHWFQSKEEKTTTKGQPQMLDLEGNSLSEGDWVMSLRYDMGKSRLLKINHQFVYESAATGKQVSWLKMIDAATDRQKVRKLLKEE